MAQAGKRRASAPDPANSTFTPSVFTLVAAQKLTKKAAASRSAVTLPPLSRETTNEAAVRHSIKARRAAAAALAADDARREAARLDAATAAAERKLRRLNSIDGRGGGSGDGDDGGDAFSKRRAHYQSLEVCPRRSDDPLRDQNHHLAAGPLTKSNLFVITVLFLSACDSLVRLRGRHLPQGAARGRADLPA
jgi:hypothetical protein